jgi:ankyrin repeat protein
MAMNAALDIFNLIEDGNVKDLRALVRSNSKVARSRNDSGQSPIIFAQFQQREALAEILLTAHPFVDIGEAAALGQLDRIREILCLEPELMDSPVYDGLTPLHLAARFGQAQAVQLLLEHGSSTTSVAKNETGVLPIHCAVQSKDLETIEILLDAEALVCAVDNRGWTPMHYAVSGQDAFSVTVLLKYGGDATQLAHDGLSSIERASGDTLQVLEGACQIFV